MVAFRAGRAPVTPLSLPATTHGFGFPGNSRGNRERSCRYVVCLGALADRLWSLAVTLAIETHNQFLLMFDCTPSAILHSTINDFH